MRDDEHEQMILFDPRIWIREDNGVSRTGRRIWEVGLPVGGDEAVRKSGWT